MLDSVIDPENELEGQIRLTPNNLGGVLLSLDLYDIITGRRIRAITATHSFPSPEAAQPYARGILETFRETGLVANLCIPLAEWRQIEAPGASQSLAA